MCEVCVGERANSRFCIVGKLGTQWEGGGVKGGIISQNSSLKLLLVLLFGDMVLLEAT